MVKQVVRFAVSGVILLTASASFALTQASYDTEPKYKTVMLPSEKVFLAKTQSEDNLVTNLMAGVIQGFDSNVNLDATHKPDNYTQEVVDAHFTYPVTDLVRSRFGFDLTNVTYYTKTDNSILDGTADISFERPLGKGFTASVGYLFDLLWYPNDTNGTYVGNEFSCAIKQDLTRRSSQKVTYRVLLKDFTERKARLGNGNLSGHTRQDVRNTFEHEFSYAITKYTKVKLRNQVYLNDSNDQYYDYYTYVSYKTGGSLIQSIMPKLYGVAAFTYERRDYDSRQVSDRQADQWDNYITVSTTLLYDITKNISAFANYTHLENNTNEPLERYTDNLYTAGVYYSF